MSRRTYTTVQLATRLAITTQQDMFPRQMLWRSETNGPRLPKDPTNSRRPVRSQRRDADI